MKYYRWNHREDNEDKNVVQSRNKRSPCHFHRRFRSPFSNIKIIPLDINNIIYEHVRERERGGEI